MTEKLKNDVMSLHDRFRYMRPDQQGCETLARETAMTYPMAVLLWQRGIKNSKDAENFLSPQLAELPSPFLLKDMDRAVDLVVTALREKWPIYIHGDYDVDGITSSALLTRFFEKLGRKVTCYHPDRLTEGYGLQESFIRAKAPYQKQSALLITVDCGISDFNEVEIAKELGFKVIITDHHLPGDELPKADAIVNPRQKECAFPFQSLAGVGVAFYLAYGIRNRLVEEGDIDRNNAPNLKKLMDLVAMGTVADVMPLTGINRLLVRAGLEIMNQPECTWALALQKQQNNFADRIFTSEDISYRFAPRINAPGRLGQPEIAFELLSCNDPQECDELAIQIEELNQQRRKYEAEALEQVLKECERQEKAGASAFVVYGQFHQGIIGIIASRAVDRFKKPVIVFTDDSSRLGTIKGSGRSIESINLYEVLHACSEAIIQFGGHAMAAGLAVHKDNLNFFSNKFESFVSGLEVHHVPETIINIDHCTFPEEVLEKNFLQQLQLMQPFGNGNPEPVFLFNKPIFNDVGTVKNHLTFTLKSNGKVFKGIGFGMADKIRLVKKNPVQMAFKMKKTVHRGECRFELHTVDIVPAS